MLPAQCLPGQLGPREGLRVGLQTRVRAASKARPREPGAHAAGSGAEAGLPLGPESGVEAEPGVGRGWEPGPHPGGGRARGRGSGRGPAGLRARVEAGPEPRGLPTPLGFVPRPEPGWRGPWRGSRFLGQKSSVLWRVRRGRAVDSDWGPNEVPVATLNATIAPSDGPACLWPGTAFTWGYAPQRLRGAMATWAGPARRGRGCACQGAARLGASVRPGGPGPPACGKELNPGSGGCGKLCLPTYSHSANSVWSLICSKHFPGAGQGGYQDPTLSSSSACSPSGQGGGGELP